MLLQRLLTHLQQAGAASLDELARVVDAPPDVVRGMLETLQRRGLVHRRPLVNGCGSSCRQCDQGGLEVYSPGRGSCEDASPGSCGRKTNAPGG